VNGRPDKDQEETIGLLPFFFRRLARRLHLPGPVLSAEQVVDGFRSVLDRDPESDVVIRQHAALGNVGALHRVLRKSHEYRSKNEPGPMDVGPDGLEEFVARVDALGGAADPRATTWWGPFRYRRRVRINENLDPFSSSYVDQQIALYRELSGREIDQGKNELSAFHLAEHVAAVNPYAYQPPSAVGLHLSRLSRALQHADLGIGDQVVDMGSGWGLSSEVFAYAGLKITALDINPDFVELIRLRSARTGLPITAVQGTFEDIPGGDLYHAALYYECLHHAIRPWQTLSVVHERLRPGGKLILAGETISDSWRHWGMLLDPLSVYCIRKYGWFETGFTVNFLKECIRRSGFDVRYCRNEGGTIGWIIIAVARTPPQR
jgi:2-polyprenyl-3-methyl-5-hydroxy-6-metoxy-1,4-benzoquinol methylase